MNRLLASGGLFRDSEARFRIDYDLPDGHRIRMVDDVSARLVMFIDLGAKTLIKEPYQTPSTSWSFRRVAPRFTNEEKIIEGVHCEHAVFRKLDRGAAPFDAAGDAWLSRSLGIVMQEENPGEGWLWRVISIVFREPEADTFNVPIGYTEVEDRQ